MPLCVRVFEVLGQQAKGYRMPSSITWLDHDREARERSLKILALFQEKESRDELGLGGISLSFADQLFPGTSTIQTRLRYMLFVPWAYGALEAQRVASGEMSARAQEAERDLIDAMRNVDVRQDGVFGGRKGRDIKRLPSSVYWAGLGAWGIRLGDLGQDQYHRRISRTYELRDREAALGRERARNGDDSDQAPNPASLTWHARLPEPPSDFPQVADFGLRVQDAQFLTDRLVASHPESLLAHLAQHCAPADVSAPWYHPDLDGFSDAHRVLLEHGRRFSTVMHGAARLYNIALSELRGWDENVERHRSAFKLWFEGLDRADLSRWSTAELWDSTVGKGHTIGPKTRTFVERWIAEVLIDGDELIDRVSSRALVRLHEQGIKKRARSRFLNRRALDQWGGSSGLAYMTYRWPTTSTFLDDLHAGLESARSDA